MDSFIHYFSLVILEDVGAKAIVCRAIYCMAQFMLTFDYIVIWCVLLQLQNLPLEMLDMILLKTVAKIVLSTWEDSAYQIQTDTYKHLATVWSAWNNRLTTRWFNIVLQRNLKRFSEYETLEPLFPKYCYIAVPIKCMQLHYSSINLEIESISICSDMKLLVIVVVVQKDQSMVALEWSQLRIVSHYKSPVEIRSLIRIYMLYCNWNIACSIRIW